MTWLSVVIQGVYALFARESIAYAFVGLAGDRARAGLP
jgi:hypothetical protein